jgi:RimJ/RimL family protein N-acetyltransferase
MLASGIQIRPLGKTDIPSLWAALDGVARERKYLAFVEAPSLAETRQFVLEHIEKKNTQIVATKGDDVIGWCDVIVSGLPGFTHCGRLGMGVVKKFRGQGIGTRLVDVAIRRAKEIGLLRIELDVFSSNEPAIRLYQKFGFVLEGRKSKARFLDGVFEDVDVMGLLLENQTISA